MSQTKAQLISDLVQALNFTGTSSAPANGVYLSAANTIKLSTNSNPRLTIDSSGNATFGGTCTATTFIGALTGNASGSAATVTSAAQTAITSVGTLTSLQIANHLGLGIAGAEFGSGVKTIVLQGAASTKSGCIDFRDNDSSTRLGHIFVQNDTTYGMSIGTSCSGEDGDFIRFHTGALGSTRMSIKSDGNVGIGTTTPGQKLGVAGNIRFEAGDPTLEFNNGGAMVYARVANTLQFASGGGPASPTEKMRIDSSGRLLIADAGTATNTPMETFGSAILQIATGGGASIVLGRNDSSVSIDNGIGNIYFDGNVASGGAWNDVARISCAADGGHADGDYPTRLTFHTTADSAATVSERLRIDSNGYIGIKLINPHLYYAKDLVVQAINQGGITVRASSTTDTNYLMFADGTSGNERYRGYIGYAHNTGADNGEHMQFAASGGTGLMRFYADGIALGGETAPANRLNDYEEGDYTPTCPNSDGVNNADGKYTKVGNICVYCCSLTLNATSSTSHMQISLPFTVANGRPGCGVVRYSNSPNWNELAFHVNAGGTTASLYELNGAVVTYAAQDPYRFDVTFTFRTA